MAKAGALYRNEAWDLVDARNASKDLDEIAVADLPPEMRTLDTDERKQYVAELAAKRESISREIRALAEQRQTYIAGERRRLADADGKGLDEAIIEGIRELAGKKGFEFE